MLKKYNLLISIPLHQERGQKRGKPGKAWPDRSFRAFCRACHKSVAWKSMVTAAKAGLLRLPCPQKPGFRGYTPLYQDCQETAAWKSTVSAAKPGLSWPQMRGFCGLESHAYFFLGFPAMENLKRLMLTFRAAKTSWDCLSLLSVYLASSL